MPADAFVAALTMLARRELSEAQIRQRLARRGFDEDAIEAAVSRLKSDRSLDDERVAAAIARTEIAVRRRGRLRVQQRIQAAGISAASAQRAVDDAFRDVDDDELLTSALVKRLRGRTHIAGDRERARLYRYLIGQGFESHRVMALLRRYSRTSDDLQ